MPDLIDLTYVALFTIALTIFEHYVGWPRMRRLIASGVPGARVRVYRTVVVAQWLTTIGAVLLLARHHARPRTIWLVAPTPIGLALAVVVLLFTTWLLRQQYRTLARMEGEKLDAVQHQLSTVSIILPHERRELRVFLLLAVTAGVCEELLYRGYALWVLDRWMGLWGAAIASTVLFGLGHSYQGRAGALRATVLGAVFVLLFIVTRSIVPGIVLHALIDIGGGYAGLAVFRERAPA